jgi:NAD+ synthase
MNQLVKQVKEWFENNGLTTAVVGFSGGIDSATTIALLRAAGIETYAVIISADNQSYTSDPTSDQNVKWLDSIGAYSNHFLLGAYPFENDDAANEAWLPVERIAALDGYTAALRARGEEAILVGTVNLSETAFTGFWGRRSDAACDFYPISHLTKTEVFGLAKELGVPDSIICAVPSGDLQFTNTNDYNMLGASYRDIDNIISIAINKPNQLFEFIRTINNPRAFCNQIYKNKFKYKLPFPGFHLNNDLEDFRVNYYPKILKAAEDWLWFNA